jgi:hypothetical protein
MIWDDIAPKCKRVPAILGYPGLYLTRPDPTEEKRLWLIGPYEVLARLAPVLRMSAPMRAYLAGLGVRFGQRGNDNPPFGDQQPRIGPRGELLRSDHRPERKAGSAAGAPASRATDDHVAVARYWNTQTLQAHHIVEKSILGALGVNRGDLADEVAPTVLVSAELHQRLFTAEMAGVRRQYTREMDGETAYAKLTRHYDHLYARPVFRELRTVADLVNREARVRKKAKE